MAVNKEAMRAFMGRFMEMTTGAAVLGVVAVADRTGLFRDLQGQGPLGLDAIAARSGLQPRYLEEILATLSAAGILDYHADSEHYELSDEHAACLAGLWRLVCCPRRTTTVAAVVHILDLSVDIDLEIII